MKLGIYLGTGVRCGAAYPDYAIGAARLAEEAGYDSIWAGEHVVLPASYSSRYPYSPDGRRPGGPATTAVPDPLAWLAFAAAVTRTIRLVTGVLQVFGHDLGGPEKSITDELAALEGLVSV